MDYRELLEALEARYGAVMAEVLREEIRKADNGDVVYFHQRNLAVSCGVKEAGSAAEFPRAA